MAKIVIQDADKTGKLLDSIAFGYEDELKRYIIEHPSLLQLDSVTDDQVKHITVGEEWHMGPGRADIVLLGSDGILTVVETKLKRNPEARRAVIAQVMEYGAYVSEWTAGELQDEMETFLGSDKCPKTLRGKSVDEAIGVLLKNASGSEGARDFLALVEQNLRAGQLRLIVAVDEVGEEAQKIVTFVNSFSTFDLFLLKISEYKDEGTTILVPQLMGYARKVRSLTPRSRWTWQRLEESWDQSFIEKAQLAAERFKSVLDDQGPEIRLYRSGFTAVVHDGWKLFGVEFSTKHGAELWFWGSDEFKVSLPDGVGVNHRTPKYFYVSGDFDRLADETLLALCEASMKQWREHSQES